MIDRAENLQSQGFPLGPHRVTWAFIAAMADERTRFERAVGSFEYWNGWPWSYLDFRGMYLAGGEL